MEIEHCIKWSIYNHPILYRDKDYEKSRLKVLRHLFFVIGNGYEWHPDGYLLGRCKQQVLKVLPEGYFEKKLYDLSFIEEDKLKVKDEMGDRFHYIKENKRNNKFDLIFEADENEAFDITMKLSSDQLMSKLARNFCYVSKAESIGPLCPYPLCEYSGLVEILKGRTNSVHQENFDLVVKPDWLAGCVDVAKDALHYFNNESRFINDCNYPKNIKSKLRNNSDEECELIWLQYKNEQLGYLNSFLEKFT